MDVSRESIPGRPETIAVRTNGPWSEVLILGYDNQPRTVWKYADVEDAKKKAVIVKEWMEAGKLW